MLGPNPKSVCQTFGESFKSYNVGLSLAISPNCGIAFSPILVKNELKVGLCFIRFLRYFTHGAIPCSFIHASMTLLATDILKRVAIINNLTFKLELTNLSQNRIGCYDCCFVCASCLVALFRGFVVSNQICACTVSNKNIRAHTLSAVGYAKPRSRSEKVD